MRSKDQGFNPFPFTANGIEKANTVEPGRKSNLNSGIRVSWLGGDQAPVDHAPDAAAITLHPDTGLILFNQAASLYMGLYHGSHVAIGFDVNRPQDWYVGIDEQNGHLAIEAEDGISICSSHLVRHLLSSISRRGIVRIPIGEQVVINGSPAWNLITLGAKNVR